MKQYFNSLPTFKSTNVNIDREAGILKNTCVAEFGDNKNDSYFDNTFLEALVEQGNAGKGIKSRFGHPNMCSTSFGTFIGRYHNFRIENRNVYADLHLDETAKTTPNGNLFDYVLDMADKNPDMFGNSIHIYSEVYQKPINGEVKNLHNLETFKACDLVDEPAATKELFSDSNDLGVIITDFLDNNPKIFDVIQKKPEIISDFFERYTNYSNRKSLINFNMSFLSKLKDKLAGKKDDAFDIDITLGDGSIVTVKTDANEPQIGDEVVDDSGNPLADGDYVTTDGGTITVAGGTISDMTQAPDTPADPTAEPTMQDVMNSVNNLSKIVTGIEKKFNATQKENESAFNVIADKLNVLGKNVKSKFDVPRAENTPIGKGAKDNSGYDPDKAREIRENRHK